MDDKNMDEKSRDEKFRNEVLGWNKLLDDDFFGNEDGGLSIEDAQRILMIIGEYLFLKGISFSYDNKYLILPNGKAEVVGRKTQLAKEGLEQLATQADSDSETSWTYRFQTEQDFQSYIFKQLDFIIFRACSALPDIEELSPQTRSEMQAERDNINAREFEFEIAKEIGKAEAARQSAEEAHEAAEEARKAAEKAKITADMAVGQVATAQTSAKAAQTAAEEARNAAGIAKKTAEMAKDIADSIMPNMLTTLGVFIAIVIAVVGCYLSVLLSQHIGGRQGETTSLSLVTLLLMGHILLNIIFMLLYLISKMSAHTLACHCLVGNQMDCQQCNADLRGQCRLQHKLWLRYPYVVVINGMFVASYCALGLWNLLQHYFGTTIETTLMYNQTYAAVAVGLTAAFIVIMSILIILFFLRSPRQRLDAQRKRDAARQKKAQQVEQKKESDRKKIRKLCTEVNRQKTQIAQLQTSMDTLNKKLNTLVPDEDRTLV